MKHIQFFAATLLLSLILPAFSGAADSTSTALDLLEEVDQNASTNNADELNLPISSLLGIHPSDLNPSAERLSILATQGRHSKTRTAAFAAWMYATDSVTEAYWLARYSPTVLIDFVHAIPLVNSESLRNANYDFILQLAKTGIADPKRPVPKKSVRKKRRIAAARALASMTIHDIERIEHLTDLLGEGIITEADMISPTYLTPSNTAPREVVEYWTLEMLKGDIRSVTKTRNRGSGKEMFRVATCIQCHVVAGEGTTLGPDLSDISKQFNALELLEHIMDPSMKIDDEYKSVIIELNDKKELFGTILEQNDDFLRIVENPLKPETAVTVKKIDIKLIDPIELSPMPEDLLIILSKDEIWDLLAYLLYTDSA